MTCTCTVEPHPNEVLETMKNTLPHQASKGIQQIEAKGYLNCLDYYKKVSLYQSSLLQGSTVQNKYKLLIKENGSFV